MEMGQKIYNLRIQKGLTLEELGNMVGVGKSTVRKWENGMIANMKRDKILKISEALATTPAYLMGWDEEDHIHTFSLYPEEQDHIKKYRELDSHGKEMVDFTLQKEWERSTAEINSERRVVSLTPKVDPHYINAAHADDYANASEELKKLEEDIMDDDAF